MRETREEVRVVLIHHPPVDGGGGIRNLGDHRDLAAILAREGAELLLHGHSHSISRKSMPGPKGPIPVLGICSASSIGRNPRRRAAYYLIDIDAKTRRLVITARQLGVAGQFHVLSRLTSVLTSPQDLGQPALPAFPTGQAGGLLDALGMIDMPVRGKFHRRAISIRSRTAAVLAHSSDGKSDDCDLGHLDRNDGPLLRRRFAPGESIDGGGRLLLATSFGRSGAAPEPTRLSAAGRDAA